MSTNAEVKWWEDWLVQVPEYDADGVKIERFDISEEYAAHDMLRAAMNPQRENRSVRAGTYTRLEVDDTLWMTDTPAEIADLLPIGGRLAWSESVLIVGLGLGLVLNYCLLHCPAMERIDVVEKEQRVVDAVGPYYLALAKERGIELAIHCVDIHEWRQPRNIWWEVGFFDIWPTITMDDRPEVTRLRNRFRDKVGFFEAWAQRERNSQAKRIRERRGFY
jgi:hypothetical protein